MSRSSSSKSHVRMRQTSKKILGASERSSSVAGGSREDCGQRSNLGGAEAAQGRVVLGTSFEPSLERSSLRSSGRKWNRRPRRRPVAIASGAGHCDFHPFLRQARRLRKQLDEFAAAKSLPSGRRLEALAPMRCGVMRCHAASCGVRVSGSSKADPKKHLQKLDEAASRVAGGAAQ